MSHGTLSIGQTAALAGVSADTIRYYERVGVLAPAPRAGNGYRYYSQDTIERVLFIRNAIRFGFPVKTLAGFLKRCDSGRPPCHAVRAEGEKILIEMDRQLTELAAARQSMASMLAAWDERLQQTPPGARAHLLATAAPPPASARARFHGGGPPRKRTTTG